MPFGSMTSPTLSRRSLTEPVSHVRLGERSRPFPAWSSFSYDGAGCHVATPDPIAEIIGGHRAFAAVQRDRLLARGIDATPYPLSHLAVRAADAARAPRVGEPSPLPR
jgi:hypothetical protein